jgi:hypothetical protein
MSTTRVLSITAVLGEPATYVLEDKAGLRTVAVSSSLLIQRLLLAAYLTGADVTVELVPGSAVIKRINAFEAGGGLNSFPRYEYSVSRVATQRNVGSDDERLEVFLVKDKKPEVAYNIYDPLLQQVFEAAFAKVSPVPVRLRVEFTAKPVDVVVVQMGEVPEALPPQDAESNAPG